MLLAWAASAMAQIVWLLRAVPVASITVQQANANLALPPSWALPRPPLGLLLPRWNVSKRGGSTLPSPTVEGRHGTPPADDDDAGPSMKIGTQKLQRHEEEVQRTPPSPHHGTTWAARTLQADEANRPAWRGVPP